MSADVAPNQAPAVREPAGVSRRSSTAMLVVIAVFYAIVLALLIYTIATRDAGLQMRLAGFGAGALYAVCVWHSAAVRGALRTVTFFGLAAALAFVAEALGDNYGLIFGEYHYTGALGPRLLGVPILIIFTWGTIVYCGYSLVIWLTDDVASGPATGIRRVARAVLVGLATGFIAAGFDLMVDPLAVSGVWREVLGADAWWWWIEGGPYLPNLESWQGGDGIPVMNFVGWTMVPLVIVAVYAVIFPGGDRPGDRRTRAVPLLVYGYLYLTILGGLIAMSWFDPGLTGVIVIGTLAMGPVFVLGVLKLLGPEGVRRTTSTSGSPGRQGPSRVAPPSSPAAR
ncbi:MAG: carotenoid biosynthesis protein [Actinobacteria bacterium]|nr:carotenoid biosynthesis protein [Actinomycetota bacterium]